MSMTPSLSELPVPEELWWAAVREKPGCDSSVSTPPWGSREREQQVCVLTDKITPEGFDSKGKSNPGTVGYTVVCLCKYSNGSLQPGLLINTTHSSACGENRLKHSSWSPSLCLRLMFTDMMRMMSLVWSKRRNLLKIKPLRRFSYFSKPELTHYVNWGSYKTETI